MADMPVENMNLQVNEHSPIIQSVQRIIYFFRSGTSPSTLPSPTDSARIQAESGWNGRNGWNLVGMSCQWEPTQISLGLQPHSHQILVMCWLRPEARSQAKPGLTFGLRQLLAQPGILESQSHWPGPWLCTLEIWPKSAAINNFYTIFTKNFTLRHM